MQSGKKQFFVAVINKYVFSSAGVPDEGQGSHLHEQTLCHKEREVELCLAQNCSSEFAQQRLHTGQECFFIHPKSAGLVWAELQKYGVSEFSSGCSTLGKLRYLFLWTGTVHTLCVCVAHSRDTVPSATCL